MDLDLEKQRTPDWENELAFQLETDRIGHPLVAFSEVGSTNDVVKQLALQHAPDGLAVVAQNQIKGRGRRGRAWVSFPGQAVYLSVLLRPGWTAAEVSWLGVLGGVAAADALHEIGVPDMRVKWPNDILANGRKIGGVLVEPRVGEGRLDFAVLGVGINVKQRPEAWPQELREIATSCRIEGVDINCDEVIRCTLRWLDNWYGTVLNGGHQALLESWSDWSGADHLPILD